MTHNTHQTNQKGELLWLDQDTMATFDQIKNQKKMDERISLCCLIAAGALFTLAAVILFCAKPDAAALSFMLSYYFAGGVLVLGSLGFYIKAIQADTAWAKEVKKQLEGKDDLEEIESIIETALDLMDNSKIWGKDFLFKELLKLYPEDNNHIDPIQNKIRAMQKEHESWCISCLRTMGIEA